MKSLSFLDQINNLDQHWMSEHSYTQNLVNNQCIQFADGNSAIGVVIEGTLSVEKDGKWVQLSKGDLIGEMSLLGDEPNISEYKADEPTKILMIEVDALNSRLKHDKIFASRLYRALAGQLAATMIRRMHGENKDVAETELADIAKATIKFKKLCRLV